MKVGYVRVSTIDQNEARQIEGLKKYGIDKWYVEKISGKNTDRPELQKMLNDVSEGDTIYTADVLRIDEEETRQTIATAFQNAINLSVNAAVFNSESTPLLIQKAANETTWIPKTGKGNYHKNVP